MLLHDVGEFGGLYFAAGFSPLYEGPEARKIIFESLVKQIYFTGVQAVRPIMIVSLLAGGIIIIQTTSQLPKVGAE
ncbi:MAG TPA: ABC transporter permease, partial [Leptospiraceae bacterium]|nr:ABC transporter permease [Leptospiraceae bacterium]